MKATAPKSLRLHIGIFGRRNAGKSSLLNAITRQRVSIVSDVAGTTTDPVEKPMELLPIGPALFIDTAGIDDSGALGELRIEKTRQVFDRCDVGVIVAPEGDWGAFEAALAGEFKKRETPFVVVFNKIDLRRPSDQLVSELQNKGVEVTLASASRKEGVLELREALVKLAPEEFMKAPPVVADLVQGGDTVVLVVPIDKEAPKGRLIAPQVQVLRDLLDHDVVAVVAKERELRYALDGLKTPPALVVTDSQAFLKVAADTPASVPMTSFSILFSRAKGDLSEFVRGAAAISKLKSGSRVLIAEACSHHPIGEDIGRVKIPRWLQQFVGGSLEFVHSQGHDFPEDLATFDIAIHCGSCSLNRRAMLSRIARCKEAGVPITNYGMCIAYTLGVFERALGPFPAAMQAYRDALG